MTVRSIDNILRGIVLAMLSFILMLQSFAVGAQSYQTMHTYRGFTASLGMHSSDLSSNITELNQKTLQQVGGEVGLIGGTRVVRAKIGLLGYYSSAGSTAGSTDLYKSNAAVNFYPLAWIMKRSPMVEPYITGGLDYDQFKFYGFYVNREPGTTNYSLGEAPYLGKIKHVNATIGAGVELRLKDEYDFIHLFAEIRYGHNLSTKTNEAVFSGTMISSQTQGRVGITFGAFR